MLAARKSSAAMRRVVGVGDTSRPITSGTQAIRNRLRTFGNVPMPTDGMAGLATGLEDTAALRFQVLPAIAKHLEDVVARFRDVGDATSGLDPRLTGVVRRQGQRDVAAVTIEEHAQMARAPVDVVAGAERLLNAVHARRGRHELHQALRPL